MYHHRVRDAVKNVVFSQGQTRLDVYVTHRGQLLEASLSPCAPRCASRWASLCASRRVRLIQCCLHNDAQRNILRPFTEVPWTCRCYDAEDTSRRCSGVLCVPHQTKRPYQALALGPWQFTSNCFFDYDPKKYLYTYKQLNMASTVGEYTAVNWNRVLWCHVLLCSTGWTIQQTTQLYILLHRIRTM